MNDTLPDGWLPTPFGVSEAEVVELAAQFSRTGAETFPEMLDNDQTRSAMAATFSRLPISANTVGRVWQVFGPEATGAIVDLSVAKKRAKVPDSPFAHTLPQRTILFPDGRAVLSFVAPSKDTPPVMFLRAQHREGKRILIADALEEAAVLGLILNDVIAMVGGTPPEQEDLSLSANPPR